jgi:hypothetical protein
MVHLLSVEAVTWNAPFEGVNKAENIGISFEEAAVRPTFI